VADVRAARSNRRELVLAPRGRVKDVLVTAGEDLEHDDAMTSTSPVVLASPIAPTATPGRRAFLISVVTYDNICDVRGLK